MYHPLEADERCNAQGRIEQPTSCARLVARHTLIDVEVILKLGEVPTAARRDKYEQPNCEVGGGGLM